MILRFFKKKKAAPSKKPVHLVQRGAMEKKKQPSRKGKPLKETAKKRTLIPMKETKTPALSIPIRTRSQSQQKILTAEGYERLMQKIAKK